MADISSYDFIPLSEDNVHHLISLYRDVFHQSHSIDKIKKKFFSPHLKIKALGYFAFYKGKAVSFHVAIPIQIKYNNKIELAAQYGDSMTLPSHSGKGLFTKLGELTNELLIQNDIKFAWAFLNQNSEYPYLNKLNWTAKIRMQYFIIKTGAFPTEAILRKTKLFHQYHQNLIQQKLTPLILEKQEFSSIHFDKYGSTNKDKDFYLYKSYTTNYLIMLNNVKVWIKPLGGLLIGDMETTNEKSFFKTIHELKKLACSLGLNKLVFQASPETTLYQMLSKKYEANNSWLIAYKNFNSNFPLDKLQFTYGDLDTF